MTKFILLLSTFLLNFYILYALDFKKDIEGEKYCSVTEPVTNVKFDFSEIVSDFGYHINGNEDNMGQYSFNICKKLSRNCNNQTAAACLKKHGSSQEVIIGYDSKLYWNDGQLRFSYMGEKCNEKTNYTLNVQLHCDYKDTKNDFLGAFHRDDQCEVTVIMHTPKACLPIPENIKSAKLFTTTPSNKTLNLNPLKYSNHFAEGNLPSGQQFIIGFPVLYGHDVMCEAGTSVCLVHTTETDLKKKFINMGIMTSDIKFDDNIPFVMLTSGEQCKDSKKFSSKISFICNEEVGDGVAKFIKTDDCVNYFEWETKLACVEDKPCQISGPNGELYDFNSLANIQYKIPHFNKTNEFIHFSLCAPAKECKDPNWGSCIVNTDRNQITKTGSFAGKLSVDKKNVFLQYDNGAICNEKGDKFSTRIEFILADNPEDEEIVLIENKCEIVLHFKTLFVSQNGKNCIVKNRNDVEIDLRPLIDYNENYEATGNDSSSNVHYFLNVCRPLNSKYSLDCHGNSAVCKTVMKENKHEEELSLGHFDYVMTTEPGNDAANTNVIMKYFHGSKCPEDQDEFISSKITFFCNESAGLGNPVLKSIENCEYDFNFPTNILCSDHQLLETSNDSCELINDKTNKKLNLKQFGIFKADKVNVDICDKSSKLYTVNYKNSMILIEFAQNDKDIEVQLKCGLANTTLQSNNHGIRVIHESTYVCPFMNIVPRMMAFITPPKSNDSDDSSSSKHEEQNNKSDELLSSGFSLGYVFLIAILIIAFGAFYIVFRNPERREILLNVVKFRSRPNIRYARNINDDDLILN